MRKVSITIFCLLCVFGIFISVFMTSRSNIFLQSFDQQQQDLVDAASKALSYRQDIIEENIHLTYALQVLMILYSFKF